MKKIMLLCAAVILFSCGGNEEYEKMKESKTSGDMNDNASETEGNIAGGVHQEVSDEEMKSELTATNVSKSQYKKHTNNQKNKDVDELEVEAEVTLPENHIDSKIIKTANMKFSVDDVNQTTNLIRKMIKTKGAYISDMNQSKNRNHFYSEITIRVPNLYFDDVLSQLALNGEMVDYKRITSQDVTEEYVDIQTRLKTKRLVKMRYEEILRSKAKTVSEVLETEEKLRRIQEEIESQEGRLRYLHNQTDMSTIYLTIYEEGVNMDEIKNEKEFKERATGGFAAGWGAILNVVVALTYMWPAILITLLVLIWKRKLIVRMKNSFKKAFGSTEKQEEKD